MLDNTLLSVKEHMQDSGNDLLLIKHSRNVYVSFRVMDGRNTPRNGGVEIFELGISILSQLTTFTEQKDVGLCRDDFKTVKWTAANRWNQKAVANLPEVNYLDIMLIYERTHTIHTERQTTHEVAYIHRQTISLNF